MKLYPNILSLGLLTWAVSGDQGLTISGADYTGSVTSELISKTGSFDGQKIFPRPDATSFDWWYFDAVSTTSANESITITFTEAGPLSLIGTPELHVMVTGSFKNGSLFSYQVPANRTTLQYGEDGITADWEGTGMSFVGTSLDIPHPIYTVSFDAPEIGINGTLVLTSLAPPHYPCDLKKPGVTEVIIPNVGWANAQPDAIAVASLTISDTPLIFEGWGYHDKNWGTVPVNQAVQSWYWGHAHMGPYSIVWFDTRTPNGTEYFAGYVTKDGKVLGNSCAVDAVKVRPWGTNDEYPPVQATEPPEGLAMTFNLGDQGQFVANFTNQLVVFDAGFYQRLIGPITGGLEDGEKFEGKALCEQFKFDLSS